MIRSTSGITLQAPAKLNIGLRILRRREDGYHDIETVFVAIDWADEIQLTPAEDISMTCSDPSLPTDGRNLCVKAARALRDFSRGDGSPGASGDFGQASRGVHIHLEKHIPYGAGLGGGSSDAAAVLQGCRQLWDVDVSDTELHAVAGRLGADVPFFMDPRPSIGTGTGTDLAPLGQPVGLNMDHLVVVVPDVHVSTVEAYADVQPRADRVSPLEAVVSSGDVKAWRRHLTNDFEPSVFARHPVVAAIKRDMLDQRAAFASMSGSGSAVFGVFTERDAADSAARTLAARYEGARCWVGRALVD